MFMLFTVNNIAVLQRFVSSFTSLQDPSPVLNVSLFHGLIKLKNIFFLDNGERKIKLRDRLTVWFIDLVYVYEQTLHVKSFLFNKMYIQSLC